MAGTLSFDPEAIRRARDKRCDTTLDGECLPPELVDAASRIRKVRDKVTSGPPPERVSAPPRGVPDDEEAA